MTPDGITALSDSAVNAVSATAFESNDRHNSAAFYEECRTLASGIQGASEWYSSTGRVYLGPTRQRVAINDANLQHGDDIGAGAGSTSNPSVEPNANFSAIYRRISEEIG